MNSVVLVSGNLKAVTVDERDFSVFVYQKIRRVEVVDEDSLTGKDTNLFHKITCNQNQRFPIPAGESVCNQMQSEEGQKTDSVTFAQYESDSLPLFTRNRHARPYEKRTFHTCLDFRHIQNPIMNRRKFLRIG